MLTIVLTLLHFTNETEVGLPSSEYQNKSKVLTSGMKLLVYFAVFGTAISFKITVKLGKAYYTSLLFAGILLRIAVGDSFG